MRDASSTITLPKADEMAFGIVVSEQNADVASLLLDSVVRTLRDAGCLEHNIHIKYVPTIFNTVMATQFFAEYTDVDSVIVLGSYLRSDSESMMLHSITQGVLQIQMHWNMPCVWGVVQIEELNRAYEIGDRGVESAIEAINMVRLQVEMEAASPNVAADRKSIN